MRYDSDFDEEIESKWWRLMTKAAKHGLSLILTKKMHRGNVHLVCTLQKNDFRVVVQDLDHQTEMFYRIEGVVNNYINPSEPNNFPPDPTGSSGLGLNFD